MLCDDDKENIFSHVHILLNIRIVDFIKSIAYHKTIFIFNLLSVERKFDSSHFVWDNMQINYIFVWNMLYEYASSVSSIVPSVSLFLSKNKCDVHNEEKI